MKDNGMVIKLLKPPPSQFWTEKHRVNIGPLEFTD